ncbi:MAG: DUF2147 domain-containing protein [Rubrivivax sp.]|nr:DUF2147 domain-containing protein [Rubrivivax sp.]
MKTTLLGLTLALSSSLALAQATPVGLWKTIDDKTGKERTLVRITETGGTLTGVIEKRLDPAAVADAKCDKCADDRKDKPIQGLDIIRGAKKDGETWDGGTILNPEEGKVYKLRLTLADGGKKLEVRGFIGAPLLGRTQVWQRVE